MYSLLLSDKADKAFQKLAKRSKNQLRIINTKITEILENPYHFKPLRGDLFGARRVHIDKSFVLTFAIDEKNKSVHILDFDHHDKVY